MPDTRAAWHQPNRVYAGTTAQGTGVRFRLARNGRSAFNFDFGFLTATCGDLPNQYTKRVRLTYAGPIGLRGNSFFGGIFGNTNYSIQGDFVPGRRVTGVVGYSDLACGTGGITYSAVAR